MRRPGPVHGHTIDGMTMGGMKLVRLLRAAQPARLATYLLALWKLFRHPATPLPAKLVAVAVLGYALSPIDLIPDFVPVLGYLDDLILVPLGLWVALRLIPADLMADARLRAQDVAERPISRAGAAVIVVVWLAVVALAAWWAWRTWW